MRRTGGCLGDMAKGFDNHNRLDEAAAQAEYTDLTWSARARP